MSEDPNEVGKTDAMGMLCFEALYLALANGGINRTALDRAGANANKL
jgi:hypothetical protein